MKRFLKISILATVLLYYLTSCSSAYHLRRAIKKNPSIIENRVDTIEIIKPVISKTIHAVDSIIVNEPGVYIKVNIEKDSLRLFYEFLPDTILIIERKTVFNVPKSRQQIRLENRNKRVEIRNERKVKRTEIRKSTNVKTSEIRNERKENQTKIRQEVKAKTSWKNWIIFLLIGFLLGFICCMFLVKRVKIY